MKKLLCSMLFTSIFVSPVIFAEENSHQLYQSDVEYQQYAENSPRSLASRNMPHTLENHANGQQAEHQHQHDNRMKTSAADEHHHQYHHEHHKHHTNNGHKNIHDAQHHAMKHSNADKRQVD